MTESTGRVRKPLMSDMLDLQRRRDALKADKMPKPKGLYLADGGNPAAAAETGKKASKPVPKSAVKAAVSVTPKKPKAALKDDTTSGRGKFTYTMAATPKRDVAALRARSKQMFADSKVAAAAHKNGPGGGASTVLTALRGEKSHYSKREK